MKAKKQIPSIIVMSLVFISSLVIQTAQTFTPLFIDMQQISTNTPTTCFLRLFYDQVVQAFAGSNDARFLAISTYNNSAENELQIYSFFNQTLSTNPVASLVYGSACNINSIAFSPDNNYIIIGGSGAVAPHTDIEVYSFDEVSLTITSSLHSTGQISTVTWCPDGQHIATASKSLNIYPISNGILASNPTSTKTYESSISRCSWSPDSTLFMVGIGLNHIDVFSFSNGVLSTDPIVSKI